MPAPKTGRKRNRIKAWYISVVEGGRKSYYRLTTKGKMYEEDPVLVEVLSTDFEEPFESWDVMAGGGGGDGDGSEQIFFRPYPDSDDDYPTM
jgi:hypothetical protein